MLVTVNAEGSVAFCPPLGDHDVIAARRGAGQVELGEQRRARLERHLRRGDRRTAAMRDQADRRPGRELGPLDRQRGRPRVPGLVRADARDLERQRLGRESERPPAARARIALDAGCNTSRPGCRGSRPAGSSASARSRTPGSCSMMGCSGSRHRARPPGARRTRRRSRRSCPADTRELIIEALAVADRARDRAAQVERGHA